VTTLAMPLPEQSPYQGYLYAYPHKTAYRPLSPAVPLAEAWRDEPKDALFLYLHVPYCEMRCGFCNLFTTTRSDPERHRRYLDALERQAGAAREALGEASREGAAPKATFAVAAIGGGTPTILEVDDLSRLLDLAEGVGARLGDIPLGFETSPATATPERLALLKARGATRASIGVQSFVEAEAHGAGRPQRADEVDRALRNLRDTGFEVLNLDLMYGLPGQTPETFRHSLDRALEYGPDELFLYPLYVRPLTGLGRRSGGAPSWDDQRRALYRVGRDHLRERGFVQQSMRLFRRGGRGAEGAYRCQEDGMVGLGAGARSYTRSLHWSTEWGVGRQRVQSILDGYIERDAASHRLVDHGIALSPTEQRRRHVLQSLLHVQGLDAGFYRARFGADPLTDWPQLERLVAWGLARELGRGGLALTDAGFELSDAIGPWLVSDEVRAAMRSFDLQ
jgi:oxygen-independent coproporphyrinogen III oxidase